MGKSCCRLLLNNTSITRWHSKLELLACRAPPTTLATLCSLLSELAALFASRCASDFFKKKKKSKLSDVVLKNTHRKKGEEEDIVINDVEKCKQTNKQTQT